MNHQKVRELLVYTTYSMGGAISWLLLSVLFILVRVVRPEAGLSSLNDARYKVQAMIKQLLMLVFFFLQYMHLAHACISA